MDGSKGCLLDGVKKKQLILKVLPPAFEHVGVLSVMCIKT